MGMEAAVEPVQESAVAQAHTVIDPFVWPQMPAAFCDGLEPERLNRNDVAPLCESLAPLANQSTLSCPSGLRWTQSQVIVPAVMQAIYSQQSSPAKSVNSPAKSPSKSPSKSRSQSRSKSRSQSRSKSRSKSPTRSKDFERGQIEHIEPSVTEETDELDQQVAPAQLEDQRVRVTKAYVASWMC